MSLKEFCEEIEQMLPRRISPSVVNDVYDRFILVIQNHLNTFGRIYPTDLEAYIGEFQLLVEALQQMGRPIVISKEEKQNFFEDTYRHIVNMLPVEIQNNYFAKPWGHYTEGIPQGE